MNNLMHELVLFYSVLFYSILHVVLTDLLCHSLPLSLCSDLTDSCWCLLLFLLAWLSEQQTQLQGKRLHSNAQRLHHLGIMKLVMGLPFPEQSSSFFFPPWIDVVIQWKPLNRLNSQQFHCLASMFPLMLCLNVILLSVLLHSHPVCMFHTYNRGLTLWMQNQTFLSYENIVLGQRHERLYRMFKHKPSPCGWSSQSEQSLRGVSLQRHPTPLTAWKMSSH